MQELAQLELEIPAVYQNTGLQIQEELSFGDWQSVGQQIQRAAHAVMWWLGDWWAYGESRFGEEAPQGVAEQYSSHTLQNAAWVCKAIEPSRRRESLSFSHHDAVAGLDAEAQDKWLSAAEEEGWSVHEFRAQIKNRPHVTNNSGNIEWYTPPHYIESARKVMGSIDCDPASCDVAQEWIRAERHFTAKDNGLEQSWTGNVWMNPPYATALIEDFTSLFASKFDEKEFDQGIVLVNNSTDADWMKPLLDHCTAICLHHGRIAFFDENAEPANKPLQGQVFLYFGENHDAFAAEFRQYGPILYAA